MSITVIGAFVPLISAPRVKVLAAIILHEFKATDLHKFNPTNCDKEPSYNSYIWTFDTICLEPFAPI
ncbi:hypothetical protein H2248_007326 [Termitomyces sp. 'cryptogamus']|nr:hypothetical protein H2248_007326 [Termitomyces sp. 'cryptogamus']